MKVLAASLFFLTRSFLSFAQTSEKILFLNEYLEAADSSSAKFKGFIVNENQHWKFIIRDLKNNNLLMQGYYLDPEMQIADGVIEFWYEDGLKKNEEQYLKGKPTGIWRTWNEKGKLSDSSTFLNGEKITFVRWTYYTNDSLDMQQFVDVLNKKSVIKYYYMDGGLKAGIEFSDNKETERKSYYQSGKLELHSMKDKKGKQIFVKRFSETGAEISEKEHQKQVEQMMEKFTVPTPEFKSGGLGFQIYLTQNLKIPPRIARENMNLDEIKIKFYLNNFGKAYDIVVENVNDPELINVVSRFFETSPAWDMKGLDKYGPLTYIIKLIH